jgi:multicomponent Na+:H+ antiporter subunit D
MMAALPQPLLVPLALGLPLAGALAIVIFGRIALLRELATLITGVALVTIVATLVRAVADGAALDLTLIEMLPGLPLRFTPEPLGALFAALASALWLLNSIFSIGYMRGTKAEGQTRFYFSFAVAIAAAMGIALAGNMLTLFVAYEVLTLSTYPLVTHHGTNEARTGGRIYLGYLLGTSIGLLLLAMVWTWLVAGTLDFTKGGILADRVDERVLPFLLALYVFGTGKAALMPVHRWLPAAMVAPTPVSAFLHAVAVVKAGVFTVLKTVIYIFGLDFLASTQASAWLVWAAAFTIVAAGLVAMAKDDLKLRLAYSTVGQLGYVVLAAALATPSAILGGALQVVAHGVAKITLFMCAGAIYVAHGEVKVSALDGLGRKMPVTFTAFFIAACSIIGLPPLIGLWSKWQLFDAALSTDAPVSPLALVSLVASSLISVGYLMPIFARAFFQPAEAHPAPAGAAVARDGIAEAPFACVFPLTITALATFALFFARDAIITFLEPIFH